MKKNLILLLLAIPIYFFILHCGSPTPTECKEDSECPKAHSCSDGQCKPTALSEKKVKEKTAEPKSEEGPADKRGESDADEPQADENSFDKSEAQIDEFQTTEEVPEASDEPADDVTPEGEPVPEGSKCNSPAFQWKGRCVTPREFCKTKFSSAQQVHIQQPYSVVFDQNGTPLFCKTNLGSYYLPSKGYKLCDRDGDGWISISAYRTMNSTEKVIRDNARCNLRKAEAIVYHSDTPGAKPQLQFLKNPLPLIETERNDGFAKNIDLPVYPEYTQSLPKTSASTCTADSDCNTGGGELCYLGQCIKARRFKPDELNSLTKACVKSIDLNDNSIEDPLETPNDSTTPSELSAHLSFGYFVELNYGYYQKDYNIGGRKLPVYHIFERSRRESPDKQGLALLCGQDPKGKKPDYWKYCALKSDQRCGPSGAQKGLSHCWMDRIEHGTRSLFKCAVFDGQKDPKTYFFHPNNFGIKGKYTRSICRLKAAVSGGAKDRKDVKFECKTESNAPKTSKNEVGWACITFHPYQKPDDYVAGCIDECAESKNTVGALQPCGSNESCKLETGSYGRGLFQCKTGNKGACGQGQNYCSWGKLTKCQGNVQPTTEKCDGIDNDCDGFIDEDPKDNTKSLSRHCYGSLIGCSKKHDGTYSCNSPCQSGIQNCYTGSWQACRGQILPSTEICNGRDDNCNGIIDESCPKKIQTSVISTLSPVSKELKFGTITSNIAPSCSKLACPPGTVITSISIASGGASWIRMMGYTCSKAVAVFSGSTSYLLEFHRVKDYNCKSQNYRPTAKTQTVTCPKGYVITGLSGRKNTYINQLTVWCSKVEVKKLSRGYEVIIHPPQKNRTIGISGGSPFTLQKCPPETAFNGIELFYNDNTFSEISGFKAKCNKLEITIKDFGFPTNYRCSSTRCPPGYIMTGIRIRRVPDTIKIKLGVTITHNPPETWIRKLEPICSIPIIKEDKSRTPYRYSIYFSTKQAGFCQSIYCCTYNFFNKNFDYTTKELKCPSGYAVVGFSGRYTSYLEYLNIWCSKVELKSIGRKYQIILGNAKDYGGGGKPGKSARSFKELCPKNTVINGIWSFFSDKNSTEITGFTATCSSLIVK